MSCSSKTVGASIGVMRTSLKHHLLVWLGLCLLPGVVLGHQDPMGETHPSVVVENGNFSIYFLSLRRGGDNRDAGRMIFSPSGEVLVPKHLISDPKTQAWMEARNWRDHGDESVKTSRIGNDESARSAFVLQTGKDGLGPQQPLPIDSPSGAMVTSSWVDPNAIAILWSETLVQGEEQEVLMKISWIDRASFSLVATVDVGKAASIYDFPSASNLVWAEGKMWFAWVKEFQEDAKDQKFRWKTILTSYDPVTKSLQHKELPQPSNWNTGISMRFLNGWLCLAWHCTKDGSYPGEAAIITAFEKVRP